MAPYLVFPAPKLDEVIPTKKSSNFTTYFKFDPNNIQRDSFLMLGFLSPDFDILEAYRKNTIIKNMPSVHIDPILTSSLSQILESSSGTDKKHQSFMVLER